MYHFFYSELTLSISIRHAADFFPERLGETVAERLAREAKA